MREVYPRPWGRSDRPGPPVGGPTGGALPVAQGLG